MCIAFIIYGLFIYLLIDYQNWFTFGTTEFVGSTRKEMLIMYTKFVKPGRRMYVHSKLNYSTYLL